MEWNRMEWSGVEWNGKREREHREEEPTIVLWATHILLWFIVKNAWHTALHNVVTTWFHLSPSHFASPWFSHLSGLSKPLLLNLKDSYSWIWWLRSIHLENTKRTMSQAPCNVPEKAIFLGRARLLNAQLSLSERTGNKPISPSSFEIQSF